MVQNLKVSKELRQMCACKRNEGRRTNYCHIHLHTSIEHAITPLIISVSNYASPLGVLNGAIVRSGSLGILILPNVCS